MALRESEYAAKLPKIGVLCDSDCEVTLLAQELERAGKWTCDFVTVSRDPLDEPPAWDALLVDGAAGLSPQQAVAHFGTSAPVIAVVKSSADILDCSDELDGAHAFVEEKASPAHVLLTLRTLMNAQREAHRVRAGLVQVDFLQNVLRVGELSVQLTAGEARVVGCLARSSGRWWSSKELLRELGTAHETSSPVWQHVGHVRTKLGELGRIIESSQALGYRLNPCAANGAKILEAHSG